jgi:hypothetical protein
MGTGMETMLMVMETVTTSSRSLREIIRQVSMTCLIYLSL